ncbi:leucine-rich repeat-containing protein 15-like [Leptopilina boulardi]|uniref:leucine-rich repeat-containing protein 15-like n=1 Tax=Leptopilina boulardi TaxID=63433 RepID=UPI0021F4FFE9|nr:leucine-rich repeat-containing protein 15-like [Leptopilina boulardi]
MFVTIFFTIFLVTGVTVGCEKQAISFDITEEDIFLEKSTINIKLPDCPKSSIKLNLSHMGINNITDNLTDSPFFTCLNLENNDIVSLQQNIFQEMTNLTYLNLANNQIPDHDLLSFGGHEKLQTLILDGNVPSYSHTLHVRGEFPKLEKLFLREMLIEFLPNDFGSHFPSLTHFYLSNNIVNVSNLYNFVNTLPTSVTHLYLEQNGISVFRSSVLNNITELLLDGNEFKVLDRSFDMTLDPSNTPTLEHLSARSCKISKIGTTAFYGTYNLTTLDLSNNYIEQIPDGLFNGVSNLKNLSLSSNFLNEIPRAISLSCLRIMHLNYNRIQNTSQLSNLTGLEILSLRGNNITHLGECVFGNMTNLRELDLAENNIKYFMPNAMVNLKFFNLNFNYIDNIEALFLRSDFSLEHLYLKGNPLSRITVNSLMNMPENLTLYIGPMRHPGIHSRILKLEKFDKRNNKMILLEKE